jgi:hypothetical protein
MAMMTVLRFAFLVGLLGMTSTCALADLKDRSKKLPETKRPPIAKPFLPFGPEQGGKKCTQGSCYKSPSPHPGPPAIPSEAAPAPAVPGDPATGCVATPIYEGGYFLGCVVEFLDEGSLDNPEPTIIPSDKILEEDCLLICDDSDSD